MKLDLAGKSVLVTGSSRGIGRTIAEVFHEEGCGVAINGRNASDLDATAATMPGAIALTGDMALPEEAHRVVAEASARLGRLDVVVCNVGSGRSVPPGNETPEEWQRMFALNLWSTTNVVEAARAQLALSHGAIICISSICGLEVVPGAPVTYSAAKAALHAYVRGVARPLGAQGIRINAIAPGNIMFDGSVWSKRMVDDADAVSSMLDRDVPLRRLGSPREIAELAAYLASSSASFATGSVWTLDGGQVRS